MAKAKFPKVKEAREALAAKALELFESYNAAIKVALANGEYAEALKHLQWLIEHMPAEDGVTMIDSSAATPKESQGQMGPQINIGIKLGGVSHPEDGPKVINVVPIHELKG